MDLLSLPLCSALHSSLRHLQWYRWRCHLSYKRQSPSFAWSSGRMAELTVMCGPWTLCSCSLCCLAPTRTLLSSPLTLAVALTSLPTGVILFQLSLAMVTFLVKLIHLDSHTGNSNMLGYLNFVLKCIAAAHLERQKAAIPLNSRTWRKLNLVSL